MIKPEGSVTLILYISHCTFTFPDFPHSTSLLVQLIGWIDPQGPQDHHKLLGYRFTKAITTERPQLPIYFCINSPFSVHFATCVWLRDFSASSNMSTCHSVSGGGLVLPSLVLQISFYTFTSLPLPTIV